MVFSKSNMLKLAGPLVIVRGVRMVLVWRAPIHVLIVYTVMHHDLVQTIPVRQPTQAITHTNILVSNHSKNKINIQS